MGGGEAAAGAGDGVAGGGDPVRGAGDGVADGCIATVGDATGVGVGDAFSSLARRRIRSLTKELTDEIAVSTRWMAAVLPEYP